MGGQIWPPIKKVLLSLVKNKLVQRCFNTIEVLVSFDITEKGESVSGSPLVCSHAVVCCSW